MKTSVKLLLAFICGSVLFANTQPDRPGLIDGIKLKISYGSYYLLPSLQANSNLLIDSKKGYPDIWLSAVTQIRPNIRYSGALELSNLPPRVIGTNYGRDDYPISTGRFQESRIDYYSETLSFRIGRANFFDETFRSEIYAAPTNGDGFSWVYQIRNLTFKHVMASLPAEISGEDVFRRMLNYHHLTYQFNNTTIGAGEYFIMTGPRIGLDMKRMNPFVPYSRNSHDSYRDIYEGYSLDSDSDNSVIKLFWVQKSKEFELIANLYIDEFLVDSDERETINDAILFNINYRQDFNPNREMPWNLQVSLSLCNPNFGQHPGPFTNTTSSGYPLFEYSPGLLSLVYSKVGVQLSDFDKFSISAHHERWKEVSVLSPDLRNKKDSLEEIPVQKDSRVELVYEREMILLPTTVSFSTWTSSVVNDIGLSLSLRFQYPS